MLFNSYEFLFIFLPVTFLIYFFLNRFGFHKGATLYLVISSLFFYSWWDIAYLPLILFSILFNYWTGIYLQTGSNNKRLVLITGIIGNLGLLGVFKYANFFIKNINFTIDSDIPLLNLITPLAISFFTFQQIMYLVDTYNGRVKEVDFLNYSAFVTFFPQLISGPIVHHQEMMPQFFTINNKFINYKNIRAGLLIFSIGLFKKVIIADTFAVWGNNGYSNPGGLSLIEAWITSLSYTFQLYYDFCGYTDMAIGAALIFNIRLPINFNSPYKAKNIQEFWRRWHITLGRFLKDYIYIPLGGNRKGNLRTYGNLMVIFILVGLWHGAGWTFIFWGSLHGMALVIHRIWKHLNLRLNKFVAWFITFNFLNISWVFFRADDFDNAVKILRSMFLGNIVLPLNLKGQLMFLMDYGIIFRPWMENMQKDAKEIIIFMVFAFCLIVFSKNSMEIKNQSKFEVNTAFCAAALFSISILGLNKISEFIYFGF